MPSYSLGYSYFMKNYRISNIHFLRRITLLVISVLCAINSNAQRSISEELEYVIYEEQDLTRGQQLYNSIKDADIKNMPDSVLFNYHYLGGYINSETPNHAKAIEHLIAARELCESRLGTHTIPYMEIMKGLGDEYNEIGETEKALEVFQEAIVKSMAARDYAGHAFGNLIMGVADCYETLGWLNEIPNHLMDAWSFWKKDETPLVTYNYFPLWSLEQFYRRYGMYDKAIFVSDKIIEFIKSNGGENHIELCDALYMRGNIFQKASNNDDAIKAYETALSIATYNKADNTEIIGSLYGNLACSYVVKSDFENCNRICDLMQSYYDRLSDSSSYYKNLLSIGILAADYKNYEWALSYFDLAEQGNLDPTDINLLKWNKDGVTFNLNILNHTNDYISSYESLAYGTVEWFENAYNLSTAYNLSGERDKTLDVLTSMKKAYDTYTSNGEDYILWIYNSFVSVCFNSLMYDDASTYAKERLDYINSLGVVPQESYAYYANCINDLVSAKLKAKNIENIDKFLDELKHYYLTIYGENSKQYAIYLHNRGRAYQLQNKLDEAKETLLKALSVQKDTMGDLIENTVKYYIEVVEELGEL